MVVPSEEAEAFSPLASSAEVSEEVSEEVSAEASEDASEDSEAEDSSEELLSVTEVEEEDEVVLSLLLHPVKETATAADSANARMTLNSFVLFQHEKALLCFKRLSDERETWSDIR